MPVQVHVLYNFKTKFQTIFQKAKSIKNLKEAKPLNRDFFKVSYLSDFSVDDDLVPLVVIETYFGRSDYFFYMAGAKFCVNGYPSSFEGHVKKILSGPMALGPTQVGRKKEKARRLPTSKLQRQLVTPADERFSSTPTYVKMEVFISCKCCFGWWTL